MSTTFRKQPAILLGGNHIALSVARILGSEGVRIFVLDAKSSYARYSRFCTRIDIESLDYKPTQWIEWLTGIGAKKYSGAVILPCDDHGVETVAKNRSLLDKDFRMIEANDSVLLRVLDKEESYKLAMEVGMNVPVVKHVSSIEDLRQIAEGIRYPCAVKPTQSFKSHLYLPFLKLIRVENVDELYRAYDVFATYQLAVIITELIPQTLKGYNSYFTYLDEKGAPLFHFTKRKLRQFPNLYGLGTYHVTDWSEDVAREGLKFLQKANLRGIGNVEFMRDPRDGTLKFIECNARFTATTQHLADSGINLPLLAYNRALGLPVPAMKDYRRDVYFIRFWSDFLAYREMRRDRRITTWEWIKSLLHPQKFLYFRLNDPIPVIMQLPPFIRHQGMKIRKYISSLVKSRFL